MRRAATLDTALGSKRDSQLQRRPPTIDDLGGGLVLGHHIGLQIWQSNRWTREAAVQAVAQPAAPAAVFEAVPPPPAAARTGRASRGAPRAAEYIRPRQSRPPCHAAGQGGAGRPQAAITPAAHIRQRLLLQLVVTAVFRHGCADAESHRLGKGPSSPTCPPMMKRGRGQCGGLPLALFRRLLALASHSLSTIAGLHFRPLLELDQTPADSAASSLAKPGGSQLWTSQ